MNLGVSVFGQGIALDYGKPVFGTHDLKSSLQQVVLAPTITWRLAPGHYLGFSPRLTYQRLEIAGLEGFGFASPGSDKAYGGGFALGHQGALSDRLSLGVSYASALWFQRLERYRDLLPEGRLNLQQDAEGATLTFTDGTTHRCDLVLAADGIKSGLRAAVLADHGLSDPGPRFTGSVAYRGLVERDLLRERFRAAGLEQHLLDVPQMYLAQDGHILTFPIKQGRILNIVAFLTAQPRATTWPEDQPWVRNASRAEVGAAFADWGLAARTLMDAIEAPTLWALHDIEELPHYVHGRAALLGDAAHAMLPHQGAGAGQGLEDAWFLRELLADPKLDRDNLGRVLQAYERWRLPRACRTQRTSWEAGELYEYRDSAAGADAQRLEQTLARRFDWLWQHDLLDDVRAAQHWLGWTSQPAPVVADHRARTPFERNPAQRH